MNKLVSVLAALALAGATGCAKNKQALDGPMADAVHDDWVTSRTDDGGLIVKERDPVYKNGNVPYDQRNVSLAVQQAAESVIATDDPDAWPDVQASIVDPGVVAIRGNVNTEQEAVNVIHAALAVKGVVAVISYLDWSGRPTEGIAQR